MLNDRHNQDEEKEKKRKRRAKTITICFDLIEDEDACCRSGSYWTTLRHDVNMVERFEGADDRHREQEKSGRG